MVEGKPMPGSPTILIIVGQGPIALAVGAGGGGLDIFTLIYPFSSPSPSLWETARYRLKYCLKGPLNPKQPTNLNIETSRKTSHQAFLCPRRRNFGWHIKIKPSVRPSVRQSVRYQSCLSNIS